MEVVEKIDILNLFNETEIDGVSIASMFHYFIINNMMRVRN